jgi:hypothetical protein
LIPPHAGADQLTAQLIQQQIAAARNRIHRKMPAVQIPDEISKLLCRGLARHHRPLLIFFGLYAYRFALRLSAAPAAPPPSLSEISSAHFWTSPMSFSRPFACNRNGVKVIVRE